MSEESGSRYWELMEINPDAIIYDEFYQAYLGYVERQGWSAPVACYDARKMVRILAETFVRDEEFQNSVEWGSQRELEDEAVKTAVEYLEHNTFNAWHGEHTPVFLHTFIY